MEWLRYGKQYYPKNRVYVLNKITLSDIYSAVRTWRRDYKHRQIYVSPAVSDNP